MPPVSLMRWVLAPAAVVAVAAGLVWVGHTERTSVPRSRATEQATPPGGKGDATQPSRDVDGLETSPQESNAGGGDYVVAGRVVDADGRPVAGATAFLHQGSG
jgi:protocatechuate 3,4-dioxygenase beta subunit